jgi:hypothetical protein
MLDSGQPHTEPGQITLATPTTTTTRTITGTSTIIRDVIATQIQTLSCKTTYHL